MGINQKKLCELLNGKTKDDGIKACIDYIENKRKKLFTTQERAVVKRKIESLQTNFDKIYNGYSETASKTVRFQRTLNVLEISDNTEMNFEQELMDFEESKNKIGETSGSSTTSPKNPVGRPRKLKVEEMSDRVYRDFVDNLAKDCQNFRTAIHVAYRRAELEGNIEAQRILNQFLKSERRDQLGDSDLKHESENKSVERLHPKNAVLTILNNNFSVETYKNLKSITRECNADIFPCYDNVRKFKNTMLPEKITINDVSASVDIKELDYNTTLGIFCLEKDNIAEQTALRNIPMDEELVINFIYATGIDGTVLRHKYIQKDSKRNWIVEKSLLVASMTPAAMIACRGNGEEVFKWKNQPLDHSIQAEQLRCTTKKRQRKMLSICTTDFKMVPKLSNQLTSNSMVAQSKLLQIIILPKLMENF